HPELGVVDRHTQPPLRSHEAQGPDRYQVRGCAQEPCPSGQVRDVLVNLRACRTLATSALTGTWYRAIELPYWSGRLATGHTTSVRPRFSAGSPERPGFEILYLAEDHEVALFEVRALLGSPLPGETFVPNPRGHWIVINIHIQLGRVADLTQDAQLR